MPNKTISITNARPKLFDIAEAVQKPDNHYTLSIGGEPKVVMMSHEEYTSLMETMELLSNPKAMASIKKAEEEYSKGEYVSWQEAKKLLGWDASGASFVREKAKQPYRAGKTNTKKKKYAR
ncbi:MAG: type II toxin-antitoxin system Phd/YefM family antitoxin [bacterium]|nr:type II toxin-antitoxin system Phd/YefM family antitoxin [bacterium]